MMANRVIKNSIDARVAALAAGDNSIIVLKGIPLSIVDSEHAQIDLSAVVSN